MSFEVEPWSARADADYVVATATYQSGLPNSVVFGATAFGFADNVQLGFGGTSAARDAVFEWNTDQTNDALMTGLSGSNNWILTTKTRLDAGYDFAFGNSATPTFYVTSGAAATNQWLAFYHDGSNGYIDCGLGAVYIQDEVYAATHVHMGDGDILYQGTGNDSLMQFTGAAYTWSFAAAAADAAGVAWGLTLQAAGSVTAGAGLAGATGTATAGAGSAGFAGADNAGGAGGGWTWICGAGGAAASGGGATVGGAGGSVLVQPGAGGAGAGGGAAGAAGHLIVRQPGGVAGTNEIGLRYEAVNYAVFQLHEPGFNINSDDADNTASVALRLRREIQITGDKHIVDIQAYSQNSAGTDTMMGEIEWMVMDNTAASEDSYINFFHKNAGAYRLGLVFGEDGMGTAGRYVTMGTSVYYEFINLLAQSAPPNGSTISITRWNANDSADNLTTYAMVTGSAVTTTNGSEKGGLFWTMQDGGVNYSTWSIWGQRTGVNNQAPAVGLHVGATASGHTLTGNTDLIVSGSSEFKGATYVDAHLNVTNPAAPTTDYIDIYSDATYSYLTTVGTNLLITVGNGSAILKDDTWFAFGDGIDYRFKYDEATTDSLILAEGSVAMLGIKGSSIAGLTAAANTPGNDIYLATQAAGADSGANPRGGNIYWNLGAGTGTGAGGSMIVTPGLSASGVAGSLQVAGKIGLPAQADLTIAAGVVAVTGSFHRIIVEGGAGAGADLLDTVNGGTEGDVIVIASKTSGAADTVTAKDGTGNLKLTGDFAMDSTEDRLVLMYDGSNWVELCRSNNA